jgi:hypothetical protein
MLPGFGPVPSNYQDYQLSEALEKLYAEKDCEWSVEGRNSNEPGTQKGTELRLWYLNGHCNIASSSMLLV